jgi:lipoic acid synthetase
MPKPDWLRIRVQSGGNLTDVEGMLQRLSLHTVCEEANCPNRMECFGRRTATFMILGGQCTRNCTFCNVSKGAPEPVDAGEPRRVAEAVRELGLKHVVVTSVTRDDLPDGGAAHFAQTILEIKAIAPDTTIEVLIPDFKGSLPALRQVLGAGPDVLNHNVETVPRLYPEVRPMADYARSLELLRRAKQLGPAGTRTKSGMMLGLGEAKEEVLQSMRDLREVGCDFLTLGQYLAPSKLHHPVVEYVHPDVFEEYRVLGEEMGFGFIASAPLVRSSYMAERALISYSK